MSRAVADVLDDPRGQASCQHDLLSLLRQRLYGLTQGYEDLNDHQTSRNDLALQTAVKRDTELANAYVGSIRLKLLKIGAIITRNTHRIRFLLSSTYPYQDLFALVTAKLQPT